MNLKPELNFPEQPISAQIRQRLIERGQRFYANDNIADVIRDGDLTALRMEVENKMSEVLEALVIDTQNDHNSADTPRRMAKMFIDELFQGRYQAAPTITRFPNAASLDELMIIGPLTVRSTCSHHLCPIIGQVWVGVLPSADSELIGLSKYARLCAWIMNRPQIQEEAIIMVADELERRIQPDGLAVVMEARHYCMYWRGLKDKQSLMTNSVMRGAMLDQPQLRSEFLQLMQRK